MLKFFKDLQKIDNSHIGFFICHEKYKGYLLNKYGIPSKITNEIYLLFGLYKWDFSIGLKYNVPIERIEKRHGK